MTTSDPIADMLTRIKNGYMARKETVEVPYSRFKAALAKLLARYEYVGEVSQADDQRTFTVTLSYKQGQPMMTEIKRISKPGLRRYLSVRDLEAVKQGLGYLILSTPKGLKTHIDARKERLGGEVICKVW